MKNALRDFTCSSHDSSSPSVSNQSWTYPLPVEHGDKSVTCDAAEYFQIDVLRRDPPILLVHQFITPEECQYMRQKANRFLQQSTVGGTISDSHRAGRHSRSANLISDRHTQLLNNYTSRLFTFVRQHTGYDVIQQGQEPINAVVYDPGGQYKPHCDGNCHGGIYRQGDRLASSIAYCEVAKAGGATTFTRAGIKVVPKVGDMLFFGYRLHDGVSMDPDGSTEHSGCPVLAGQKWIAVQWFREGVNSFKPWQHFSNWGGKKQ